MVDPNPGPSCCEATALTTGLDHYAVRFYIHFQFSPRQWMFTLLHNLHSQKAQRKGKHNEIHVTRTTQLTYYELNLH